MPRTRKTTAKDSKAKSKAAASVKSAVKSKVKVVNKPLSSEKDETAYERLLKKVQESRENKSREVNKRKNDESSVQSNTEASQKKKKPDSEVSQTREKTVAQFLEEDDVEMTISIEDEREFLSEGEDEEDIEFAGKNNNATVGKECDLSSQSTEGSPDARMATMTARATE